MHFIDEKTGEEVFHSSCELIREHIHVILVRPQFSGNVGAAARAMANMGIRGSFRIVASPTIVSADSFRMAKHAKDKLTQAQHFPRLEDALESLGPSRLALATTARTGSAHRPHPLQVSVAVNRALEKLAAQETGEIALVFGPESDGLNNQEVALCDWVVTIATSSDYPSLNLAQSVLLLSYEIHRKLVTEPEAYVSQTRSQRARLIEHFIQLAAESGFIHPGDPQKMKPRLEEILSQLPPYFKEVKTLHGLLDQAIRSVRAGQPDIKGRFRKTWKAETSLEGRENECR